MLLARSNPEHRNPRAHLEGTEQGSPLDFYSRDDCRRGTQCLQGGGGSGPAATCPLPATAKRRQADTQGGSGRRRELRAANRNDHAAGDNQRTAKDDWQSGRLTEPYPGDNLGQKKEQNHIHSQQLTEIPTRDIDHQSVGREGCRPAEEGNRPAHPGRTIESCLKPGVAICFEKGRQQKNKESATTMCDDLIKKVSHRMRNVPPLWWKALPPVLLLRAIEKIDWTDDSRGISLLMIEIKARAVGRGSNSSYMATFFLREGFGQS